jgi:hypothetical protein
MALPGATYSWTVVQSNVSGATSGFGTSINQTLTATTSSAGTATYTITPSANGCTGSPINVVVTVSPVPNVVALPASQTICSGATTSVALSTTNGVAGATYNWTRVDRAGVSGVLIGAGATINETLTATGSTPGTATYTITPAAGGCNGTPITVIVTVNPLPDVVAAPASETICSGTTSNINLSTSNGVAGATYSWTVVQSNVSGATSGFGTSINQTLTATTSSAGAATYTITPSSEWLHGYSDSSCSNSKSGSKCSSITCESNDLQWRNNKRSVEHNEWRSRRDLQLDTCRCRREWRADWIRYNNQ